MTSNASTSSSSSGGRSARVLSIQSHTVHGYVGQKASTFPLELLGIEVDPLNSVQLSNHKGYPKGAKGQVLQGDQLQEIVDGLDANGLLAGYTHLLTGYMGSVSFLRAVISVVRRLRDCNPDLIYFCDPVMGDHGKFYVPLEIVDVYREEIVPLATVLTPNQFEIEQLTGMQIENENKAWEACDALHARGVQTVIVTSCYFEHSADEVVLLASCMDGIVRQQSPAPGETGSPKRQARIAPVRYAVRIPLIEGRYSGTGDLMAALLLAWTSRSPGDFEKALEHSCATIHAVIRRTYDSVTKGENSHRELRIIQSAADIIHPPVDDMPKSMRVTQRT